jgi:hypothetical protein
MGLARVWMTESLVAALIVHSSRNGLEVSRVDAAPVMAGVVDV